MLIEMLIIENISDRLLNIKIPIFRFQWKAYKNKRNVQIAITPPKIRESRLFLILIL